MNTASVAPARVPPRIEPRRSLGTLAKLLIVPAVFIAVAVLYWFNPAQFGFYPRCALYETTGLLCPGCGSLRATHELLHGHLAAAFRLNALLVLSLPLVGWLSLLVARRTIQNRPVPLVVRPFWVWGGFAILLLFGIGRNLPAGWVKWLHL
jgi:hypothetical protein